MRLALIGSIVNAAVIVIAAFLGGATRRSVPAFRARQLQVLIGAMTVIVGLGLTWKSLAGPPGRFFGGLGLVVLSMILGKATGRAFRLQQCSNQLGRFASQRLLQPGTPRQSRFNDTFAACAALYCAAPLGILGASLEGLRGDPSVLLLKSLMDGLAAFEFARCSPWGVSASALPVLVWQGTLTLGLRMAAPGLEARMLVDPTLATAGMLVFCVSLVALGLKRVELADYLPALLVAPLLAWLFG